MMRAILATYLASRMPAIQIRYNEFKMMVRQVDFQGAINRVVPGWQEERWVMSRRECIRAAAENPRAPN
jgi:hypothetical protein